MSSKGMTCYLNSLILRSPLSASQIELALYARILSLYRHGCSEVVFGAESILIINMLPSRSYQRNLPNWSQCEKTQPAAREANNAHFLSSFHPSSLLALLGGHSVNAAITVSLQSLITLLWSR